MVRSLPGAACLLALPLAIAPLDAQQADSAAFVTVLGSDTLAVERWVRSAGRLEAEVAVRSPRTALRRSVLEFAPDGSVRRWEERWLDPVAPDAAPRRLEVSEPAEGGWTRTITEADSTRTVRLAGPPDALPWIDLVHWPFEVAVPRLPARGPVQLPFLAGARTLDMALERTGPGEVTVTHPLRGPSVARVDAEGRILSLDAAQTTRKVVVTRAAWTDVPGAAARWAAADRAGRGIGELSGRASEEFAVAGGTLALDYGTPFRRGRDIFGSVVPWGAVWRTGANRATHLTTTVDLLLGDSLQVPAGEYTLFTIPEPDGGWLIVNRQTGQNGTAYDAARDLGRVRMRRRTVGEPLERFTIRADGDELVIAWDRSEFAVPLRSR